MDLFLAIVPAMVYTKAVLIVEEIVKTLKQSKTMPEKLEKSLDGSLKFIFWNSIISIICLASLVFSAKLIELNIINDDHLLMGFAIVYSGLLIASFASCLKTLAAFEKLLSKVKKT